MRPSFLSAVLGSLFAGLASAQWSAVEESVFLPPAAATGDELGSAVATSGSWAAVGAPLHDAAGTNAGAVFVYRRAAAGTWTLATTLFAPAPGGGDRFGDSVAVEGELLVVGAPRADVGVTDDGEAHVFRLVGGSWQHEARLLAPAGLTGDFFGAGVATDGTRVLVGATHTEEGGHVDVGAVHVFSQVAGGGWSLEARLVPGFLADGMLFGFAMDIDGDALIAGARWYISCYVFELGGSGWNQTAIVTAPVEGHAAGIGQNCAISGDTVVVGAPSDDLAGPGLLNAGSAYVWRGGAGSWNQEAKLKADFPADDEFFGRSVGIEGDAIVIGANRAHSTAAPGSGVGYLFRRAGTTWTQQDRFEASDAEGGDEFGRAADLSGGIAVFGAPTLAGSGSGAAYAFAVQPPPAERYCTAGTSASGCQAMLVAAGTASATRPSGFTVQAGGLEGSKDGLLFYGTSGRQANPWGNGSSFQCVVVPVKRGTVQNSGGTQGACDGAFLEDLNASWCPSCPQAHRNPGPGVLVQIQAWYRDPASTSNQTTSLSDALEFGVGP